MCDVVLADIPRQDIHNRTRALRALVIAELLDDNLGIFASEIDAFERLTACAQRHMVQLL